MQRIKRNLKNIWCSIIHGLSYLRAVEMGGYWRAKCEKCCPYLIPEDERYGLHGTPLYKS